MTRRRTLVLLALAASSALGAGTCWRADAGDYHGAPGVVLAATGRFRLEQLDGVWWLVTPDGHLFFSTGVNHISSWADEERTTGRRPYRESVLARWGSEAVWADVVLARLEAIGLDTVGAWSQLEHFRGRYPYTEILGFAAAAPAIPGAGGFATVRDFFAPSFEAGAAAEAEHARACAGDAFCIGVFSDNELPWGPNVGQPPLVEDYLALPAGAPGRLALQAFFAARYAGDVAAFEAVWGLGVQRWDDLQTVASPGALWEPGPPERMADRAAFRGHVASRYYRIVHDALRAVSPDLLILGSRLLAFQISADVALAAAPWVDAFSVNAYEWNAAWSDVARYFAERGSQLVAASLLDDVDQLHALTGKPVLISEFGYRAADAGLPNSWPPVYPTLPDQAARADAYARYLGLVLERPYLIGVHWFEWADEPAGGRFDGEDDNWGVVSLADDLYADLVARMRSVHSRLVAERLALGGAD